MRPQHELLSAIRQHLLHWFVVHGRELPWRNTRNPYAVLVSEMMLQQTQVTTVIPYYRRWLVRFPTLRSLAAAPESEVLHAWQGLGYYARARNLHRCAQISVARFDGQLPRDPEQLRTLPGIGRYSANAIAVFAFERPLPIVEANSARVLTRLFDIRDPIDSAVGQHKLWSSAARLVASSEAHAFNSALVDLGATVCLPRNPRCGVCPIQPFCATKSPATLPMRRPRQATLTLTEWHALIRARDAVLLRQSSTRWRGMWILPACKPALTSLYSQPFSFTHHRITLRVRRGRARRAAADERWWPLAQLKAIPIPSPHRRALKSLLGAEASLDKKRARSRLRAE